MKRTYKKLILSKNTLRVLVGQDLSIAQGASGGPCQAVDDWFHLPSNFCVRARQENDG